MSEYLDKPALFQEFTHEGSAYVSFGLTIPRSVLIEWATGEILAMYAGQIAVAVEEDPTLNEQQLEKELAEECASNTASDAAEIVMDGMRLDIAQYMNNRGINNPQRYLWRYYSRGTSAGHKGAGAL